MDNPAVTIPAVHRLNASSRPDKEQPEKDSIPSSDRPDISLSKNDQGWRRVVRNFSPSWFSITMGTGVVGILLHSIPWQADWLNYLSIAFFILNTILFFSAFTVSVLRYTIWPEIWVVMIQDPTNSLFLGTIPMGFATLVNLWVAHCVSRWGEWAIWVGWGFWVLDSIVAVGVTVTLGILLMSAHHQRSLDSITAAQLLPIAATIVSSALGSNIAQTIPSSYPTLTLATILASYIMWGMAVPLALSVLVIYYQRLALHKLPPREVIVSAFLPLGPLGYGGFVVLNLGRACLANLPSATDERPLDARTLYTIGFIVSLIMWSYGLLWFALALASIWKAHPIPFNMGWWGFTFPLGVYALSTILIGEELPSKFFRVLGTIFAVAVVMLWVLIAMRTARGAWSGTLFHAPCLANLKKDEVVVVEEEKGVLRRE